MVYRVYVEKKPGQTHEASGLLREVKDFLQIDGIKSVRVLNRYDAENIEETLFFPLIFWKNLLQSVLALQQVEC